MNPTNDLLTIGELATQSGVSVKTIRHYDEVGILPPASVTEGGYRLYGPAERRRLEAIRSLRDLGFSLEATAMLLGEHADARRLAEFQLECIDGNLRALQRARAIVAGALALDDHPSVIAQLRLAHAAASLGGAERRARMAAYLDRVREGRRTPPDERAQLLRAALLNLPDELSTESLEAWIALSALLDDDDFVAMLREQHDPFNAIDPARRAAFGEAMQPILDDAVSAHRAGHDATDPRVRELAQRWARAFAVALERPYDQAFLAWFDAYVSRTNDERIERFWRLVARMRGGDARAITPFTAAQHLLQLALHAGDVA